jgi:hypothetical protein
MNVMLVTRHSYGWRGTRVTLGPLGRIAAGDPSRRGPAAPAPDLAGRRPSYPPAEGRSAFCGGRGPKAPFDPLVRPLRGRTTKEGPHKRARPLFGNTRALEAGGGSGDRSPGPARQPALAPGLSNARGGFCRVQMAHHPSRTRLSWGACTRRISGSPHPCGTSERPGARAGCRAGLGDLSGDGVGWSARALEPREEFGSRLWRSIASVEGVGTPKMTGTEAPPSPMCPPSVPFARGSPHPCYATRGRGQGRLTCRALGPVRRWSGLEPGCF